MSIENPLWGAPRIHGELLKLGFEIAQSSVAKYMVKRRPPATDTLEADHHLKLQNIAEAGRRSWGCQGLLYRLHLENSVQPLSADTEFDVLILDVYPADERHEGGPDYVWRKCRERL